MALNIDTDNTILRLSCIFLLTIEINWSDLLVTAFKDEKYK
jgi:hypothetical protein